MDTKTKLKVSEKWKVSMYLDNTKDKLAVWKKIKKQFEAFTFYVVIYTQALAWKLLRNDVILAMQRDNKSLADCSHLFKNMYGF